MKKFKIPLIVLACYLGLMVALWGFSTYKYNTTPEDERHEEKLSLTINGDEPDAGGVFTEPTEEELAPHYRSTLDEALKEMDFKGKEEYMNYIDEVIKVIENDKYALLWYKAIKDENTIAINMCKFKIKEEGGGKLYSPITVQPLECRKKSKGFKNCNEEVRFALDVVPLEQEYNLYTEKGTFAFSYSRFNSIFSLKIEGQPPTEIVPYEAFGETRYLWYYLDLDTHGKAPSELEVEMDE